MGAIAGEDDIGAGRRGKHWNWLLERLTVLSGTEGVQNCRGYLARTTIISLCHGKVEEE